MNAESVLIVAPHRQGVAQRNLYAGLTAFVWFAWLYLWLPLVTLVAWGAGFDVAYDEVLSDDPLRGLHDLALLLGIALVCCASLIAWAAYNRVRFGGPDRRRGVDATTPEAIARHFTVNEVVSARLRRSRRSVLHLDADGRPLRAVIDRPALPASAAGIPLES